jgi:hypothetical protein
MAAFQETSLRVNIEFLRASAGRAGRIIRFNHTPDIVPGQLQGRITPGDWSAFMSDIDGLAKSHPYIQKPNAKQVGMWAACFAIGAVVGLCVVDPDAGDYNVWEAEVRTVIDKHQPLFQGAGCNLSLVRRRDYWIQIDIDPAAGPAIPVAMGVPPPPGKPGQPPASPFETVAP